MNRFIGLVKITFLERLTYRTQFLADVSAGCVYLLSFYYLWHAIYAGRTEIAGISLGCVSFWITQTYGVNQFKNVFMAFCAGGIMPLDFYPAFLRDTLAIMPFKGCFYTPLAIYLEVAPQDNALYDGLLAYVPNYEVLLIIEQLTWILIVLGLSQVLWKKALRKIVILGG